MRIVNILILFDGIPDRIESFPIYYDQLDQEVLNKAKKLLEKLVKEDYPSVSYEELQYYKEEGYYDRSKLELYIIWSEIN